MKALPVTTVVVTLLLSLSYSKVTRADHLDYEDCLSLSDYHAETFRYCDFTPALRRFIESYYEEHCSEPFFNVESCPNIVGITNDTNGNQIELCSAPFLAHCFNPPMKIIASESPLKTPTQVGSQMMRNSLQSRPLN